jgi:PAP2 superfamily
MKRREFLNFGAVAAIASTLPGCNSGDSSEQPAAEAAQPKVVVDWSQTALEAIRVVKPGPPQVARSLAILHTAMYDAWAAYDAVAVGTRLKNLLRQPQDQRSGANKTKAMSYAAYLALLNQYPTEKARFDAKMAALGFAVTATSTDSTKPEGVGTLAAQAVLDYRRGDGSNQDGTLSASGVPYADYTGYVPANVPAVFSTATPLSGIAFPGRWQPITYLDATGVARTPGFIAAHWLKVTPFALTSASQFRPAPPKAVDTPEFAAQAQKVIDVQIALTERQKVIAEYWADGPSSELPPGHWGLFAQFVSSRDKNDNDKDVRMFFAVANAILDASIATWEAKRFYDYARPITAIRFLKNAQTIQGYGSGGPAAGFGPIQGEAWRTFQVDTFPTPPFPEYTSGHSAFSASGAEALKLFTGSDNFGATYTQTARTLRADNKLPAADVVLTWPTFTAAANEAGVSRIYGGIHFDDGNEAGLDLGRKVGAQAFAKAKSYWDGTAI